MPVQVANEALRGKARRARQPHTGAAELPGRERGRCPVDLREVQRGNHGIGSVFKAHTMYLRTKAGRGPQFWMPGTLIKASADII